MFYKHNLQSVVKYFNCYSVEDLPVCFSSMVKINEEQRAVSMHLLELRPEALTIQKWIYRNVD